MSRPRILAALAAVFIVIAAASLALSAYRAQRVTAGPAADTRPALPVRKAGVNLPAAERAAYDGEAVRRAIAQAREAGAQWVALNPAWYVPTARSCDLQPDPARTISDAGVYALMQDLERSGVRVLLKPHVEALDGSRRGELRPDDETCWFAAYRRMMEHYAELASAGGADLFAIGTELSSLTAPRHEIHWRQIATEARRAYRGPLTYAASWGVDERAEYRRIPWWDAVDFIGVNAYFPLEVRGREEQDYARAWRSYPVAGRDASWIEEVHQVSLKFDRFVILTELGYRSVEGAALAPWDATRSGLPDRELQARLFDAARRAWEREFWLEGVFLWAWDTNPAPPPPGDTGYTVHGKPAEAEVRRWFNQHR